MTIQPQVATDRPTANAWELSLGPESCSNVQAGLDHEWLVTNGLGGYAAGSVVGGTTRSYHGLLVSHLWDACLGTISEIAEPEPPFTPVGCLAQAWSVAEVLRCWLFV